MEKLIIAALGLIVIATSITKNTYTMDKNHTRVGFSATHFGISHVEGKFNHVEATLTSAKEDFTDAVIEMYADVKSVDTDVEMRDNDLRSANWFDADTYGTITFKSTSFRKVDSKNYKMDGKITIHGITKPIVFDVVYNGTGLNPNTNKKSAGFTIKGALKRLDFGVGPTLTAVVADDIELKANAEFIIN